MSRVFSRRRPVAFCCGCVSDSSGAADRVLEMREMPQPRLALGKFVRPARKLSIRPSPGWVALNHSGTKCDCKNCENNENSTKWALVPLPASALLRLPVSACLALFLLIWRLLELPCSGHASLCRWLRAWQPVTNRHWQPRPSKGASEAAEGCPNARAAARS